MESNVVEQAKGGKWLYGSLIMLSWIFRVKASGELKTNSMSRGGCGEFVQIYI